MTAMSNIKLAMTVATTAMSKIKLVQARTSMTNLKPVKHANVIMSDCYYERPLLLLTMPAMSNSKPAMNVATTADFSS